MEENIIIGFNDVVHSVVGDVSVDNEARGDFVEDLTAQSLKLLIGVGFAYVCL